MGTLAEKFLVDGFAVVVDRPHAVKDLEGRARDLV
jgi:hypothetical protein